MGRSGFSALAERVDGVHVHHVGQVVVVPDGDLLDLVGGTEAVEEVGTAPLWGSCPCPGGCARRLGCCPWPWPPKAGWASAKILCPRPNAAEATLAGGAASIRWTTCPSWYAISPGRSPSPRPPWGYPGPRPRARPRLCRREGPGPGEAGSGDRRGRRPQHVMCGPPGSGKSMLARRLPSILPDMSRSEALEATEIHSVMGLTDPDPLISRRPFRSPHHTISPMGLAGGGSSIPGRVRSPWPTTASFSWTSCPNSTGRCWRPSASPWRTAGSRSPGQPGPRPSPAALCWYAP